MRAHLWQVLKPSAGPQGGYFWEGEDQLFLGLVARVKGCWVVMLPQRTSQQNLKSSALHPVLCSLVPPMDTTCHGNVSQDRREEVGLGLRANSVMGRGGKGGCRWAERL